MWHNPIFLARKRSELVSNSPLLSATRKSLGDNEQKVFDLIEYDVRESIGNMPYEDDLSKLYVLRHISDTHNIGDDRLYRTPLAAFVAKFGQYIETAQAWLEENGHRPKMRK